jgi:hypothetical protein
MQKSQQDSQSKTLAGKAGKSELFLRDKQCSARFAVEKRTPGLLAQEIRQNK